MQLKEYSAEDFYQGQLAYLEEEQKKLEKNIAMYKKQMKKAWKRILIDIVLFLFFCIIVNALNSVDFYMEILLFKHWLAAFALAFGTALKFFYDLFRLFGEYGLPTFAKLFIGGVEFSCKILIEEAEVELAKNACKIDVLKEEVKKGELT